jgi:hypothetical protein
MSKITIELCECGAEATGVTGGLPDCDQCNADKRAFA